MLAKRTYKNQITIPKAVIDDFPGVEYFDVLRRANAIVLRPVETRPSGKRLEAVRRKVKALGLTQADVEAAIRWARKGTA